MKITKAVIPCGGLGTRFLPVTKAVPKEILPIIDTPALHHIVEEAADSGIEDCLIILGNGKDAIKKYFTEDGLLAETLYKAGKREEAEKVNAISKRINVKFGYQPEPKGSGDAVMLCKDFVAGEPFCLAWGDDVIYSETPVMKQLMRAFDEKNAPVIGVQRVETDDIVKYGVADVCGEGKVLRCRKLVEKPALKDIPSRYACLGRYILTSAIFDELAVTPLGKNNELQLTDALNGLCLKGEVYVCDFEGLRYDMGSRAGAVKACVEYALRREDIGGEIRDYILSLANKIR